MSFWSDLAQWWNTKPTKLVLSYPAVGGFGHLAIISGILVRQGIMSTPIANAIVIVTITPPSGAVVTSSKTTDSIGKFTVSVPLAIVGTYAIKGEYAGVANQYKPVSATTNITVLPLAVPTTLTLTASATSGTIGDTITISAILQA